MKRLINPTIVVSFALFFSLVGGARAAKTHLSPHRMRTVTFTSSQSKRQFTLAGRGENMFIARISIDGQEAADAEGNSQRITVYGDGVVLRFTQRGNLHVVSTIALGSATVRIRYSLSG